MNHLTCQGTLHVALPPARAAELFTPEGERRWGGAEWDPEYPGGHGGVFVTHGGATVWLDLGGLRYARVTPGVQAGTVEVRCEPDGDGSRVHVRYDLTALSPHAELERFAAEYDAMLAEWERAIAGAL